MLACQSVREPDFTAAERRPGSTTARAFRSVGARRTFAVAFALLAGSACQKPDPKACENYSKKMCDMAGAESSTCNSIKDATGLMPPAACAAALTDIGSAKAKLDDRRKACDQLVTKLCGDLGQETETCGMVKTQSKNIPPEQCTKMMGQYAELLADLKKREEKNKPLAPEKAAAIAKADGSVAAFGPADAKVTVVEFSDFQCPYCARAATVMKQLKEKYGTRVRVVFRQFPLSFHNHARLAAEASLAANAQGKFWEFHDKLFGDQTKLERPGLEASAKDIGLDVAAFTKALDAKTFAAAVDADVKLGEEVRVDGTPTMFINGARVGNPTDFDAVSKQLDAALGKNG